MKAFGFEVADLVFRFFLTREGCLNTCTTCTNERHVSAVGVITSAVKHLRNDVKSP